MTTGDPQLAPGADAPPLGVYVHWPYCARICPYCDFNVVRDRGRAAEGEALLAAIARDLQAHAAKADPLSLVSVYFGGGTPSRLEPEAVGELLALCRRLWPSAGEVEATLEANPGDADPARLAAFAGAGITRLSLGVQSFRDVDLAFLKRNHDAREARRALDAALRAFPRVSLDLISALPGQTPDAWAADVRAAARTGVEHLSTYQLTIEAGTPFARAVRRGVFTTADPDLAAAIYEAGVEAAAGEGFTAYEVSNFAKGPGARARHNLVYWRGEAYAGVGPGAHGRLPVEGERLATEAESDLSAYMARVGSDGVGWRVGTPLTPAETLEERVMMGLRVDEGVAESDLAALGRLSAAEPLVEGGWLARRGGRLVATGSGRLVLDSLSGALLA